jgi:hypothetical protein
MEINWLRFLQLQRPFFKFADLMLLAKNRNEEISKREFQIDHMVYQLYDLSEEEIAIVEKG